MLNLSPVRPRSVDNPSILAFPILLLSMKARSHSPKSHGTRCVSNLRVRARSKAGLISRRSGEESGRLVFSHVSAGLPGLRLGRAWSETKLGAFASEAISNQIPRTNIDATDQPRSLKSQLEDAIELKFNVSAVAPQTYKYGPWHCIMHNCKVRIPYLTLVWRTRPFPWSYQRCDRRCNSAPSRLVWCEPSMLIASSSDKAETTIERHIFYLLKPINKALLSACRCY